MEEDEEIGRQEKGGIQGDPSVIQMQAQAIPPFKEKRFSAEIIAPGHKAETVVCKDFRISESGGCITLIRPDGKRICVGGNSATVIIKEK